MIKHKYGVEYSISFRTICPDDKTLLSQFTCDNPAIKNFIQEKSLNENRDVSYIFFDNENEKIIGFASICCSGISVSCANNEKEYTTCIPSVEIDYFAIDEEYRSIPLDSDSTEHETLSQALFLYLLKHIQMITASIIGATHMCLYSVPSAQSFYSRCGFEPFDYYMNRDEMPFTENCVPMFAVI